MFGIINEELEKEIIDYYIINKNKTKVKDIENKFDINIPYIKAILYKNDIDVKFYRSGERKRVKYETFFKSINNEKSAYWFGFILADGYIDINGEVGIELKSDDYKHLEKFKNDLGIKNDVKIYDKNSTFGRQKNCRITFLNYKILSDLGRLGITLNKSNDGKIPYIKDEKLYYHMIRGYFDGNGSIGLYHCKRSNDIKGKNFSFCGTKEILEFIVEFFNIEVIWSKRINNGTNNYQIQIKEKDTKRVLDLIYKDATVYLQRKYDKYIQITR